MVVSSVFTWNIPQFATLSLSSLCLAPLPAAAGAAGGRHNLRRLLSLNHRDPSSRHPPPSPNTRARAFYIYTGTFKQVVFKYSDRYDTIVCTVWKCTNMRGLYVPTLHYILFINYYLKWNMIKMTTTYIQKYYCGLLIVLPLRGKCANFFWHIRKLAIAADVEVFHFQRFRFQIWIK